MSASWLSKGVETAKAMEQEEADQQARYEASKKMWRFFLKPGEEARITFVDGEMTQHGTLDAVSFKEHMVFRNGKWENYICTFKNEGTCPICDTDDRPSWVAALTIIDHREFKSKTGDKTYKDTPKLFICKKDTFKTLQHLAAKRGGLAGCTFDVIRGGKKTAAVGSQFDFISKGDLDELAGAYIRKDDEGKEYSLFQPADYAKELTYIDADTLKKMGFGIAISTAADAEKLSQQM